MLSLFLQRLLILAGLIALGWGYSLLAPHAAGDNGAPGLVLLASKNTLTTFAFLAAGALLAAAVGGVIGGLTRPVLGVFVVTAPLAWVSIKHGGMDAWLRSAESSGAYGKLALESLVWLAVTAAALALSLFISCKLNPRRSSPQATPPDAAKLLEGAEKIAHSLHKRTGMSERAAQSLLAMVTTLFVGSVMTAVLLPAAEPWQVVWGLLFAFAAGATAARQFLPRARTLAILLCPLLAAAGWYAFIAALNLPGDDMLRLYYEGRFWHTGLALPVHYASAGIAGAALGIHWATDEAKPAAKPAEPQGTA